MNVRLSFHQYPHRTDLYTGVTAVRSNGVHLSLHFADGCHVHTLSLISGIQVDGDGAVT